MNPNLRILAKIYIAFFGLLHYGYFTTLLVPTSNPGHVSFSSTYLWSSTALLVAYMLLPLLAIIIDRYPLYFAVSVVCAARIPFEMFMTYVWTTTFALTILSCGLTTLLCLLLAVDDVALNVAGEILTIESSRD